MPEYNPNARLDTSQIRDIRSRRKGGKNSLIRKQAIRRMMRKKQRERNY